MKIHAFLIATVLAVCSPAWAQTVLMSQVPVSGGGVMRASQLWQDPGPNGNDLDGDAVCWADFTLASPATIDHLEWWGNGACEQGFRIEFWRQDPGTVAYQPIGVFYYGGDHTVQPTARRNLSLASVTTAAGPGGLTWYSVNLANPVSLAANDASNVRWFVAIIGLTSVAYAPWNWAQGTGGTGHTYQFIRGGGFRSLGEGRALLLRAAAGASVSIAASASPAGSGTITGAGSYPQGTTVSLMATANSGWGFVNWTESGTVVRTQPSYTFTATANRTLVANFVPAYTVTTSAMPTYGGAASAGGVFNSGQQVTVTATPVTGYHFTRWSSFGGTVSTLATYTFPASANVNLVAEFVPDAGTAVFNFDDAPQYTSLPLDLTSAGETAHLTGGYSIQAANALGFTPAGFSGRCVYPNSVFAADLQVDFSRPVTHFSIMYSPAEIGCDTSATMRATGYRNGVFVATGTATSPTPGTWPTGTLTLTSAQPFDSVVVHYDARPLTCQDWGPEFLADNMIVVMASVPCAADFDGNGTREVPDIFAFLSAWFAQDPRADIDGVPGIGVPDIFAFLSLWFAGCP